MTSERGVAVSTETERDTDALWRRRLAIEARREGGRAASGRGLMGYVSDLRLAECLLRFLGLWRRGRRNAFRIHVTRTALEFDNLPDRLHGLRILHLSDLHFARRHPRFAEHVSAILAGIEADLCVMTGDYRYEHAGPYEHVIAAMGEIMKAVRVRYGVFGVLGNHDLAAFVEPFEGMGIRMLINEHAEVVANGGNLWIAGVDDPHYYRCDNLPLAVHGIPRDAFTLLLAHSPELALAAPDHGVDLYLCGHTHWGQVRFPVVGALRLNARCPARFSVGAWRSGTTQGYTTAGAGTTDVPVRFLCPPEIGLIELRGARTL